MLYKRERVDPIARYVAREEVPREECRGGGDPSARGGARRRWGVRIPQTMSRFLIPVLLYLRRLRPRGRPKQLKFRLLSLYRAPDFATWKRRRDKDDVSLLRKQQRGKERREGKVEAPRTTLRVRASFARGWYARGERGENLNGRKKEERYVRRRECLGRPFQSGDNDARSVYTFRNFILRSISWALLIIWGMIIWNVSRKLDKKKKVFFIIIKNI